MTDKQINKWLRRHFSVLGWVLILYYGFMTLLTSITVVTDLVKQSLWAFAMGDFSGAIDWNAINGNAWGYIVSILVGFAVLDAWKGKSFWKEQMLHRQAPMGWKRFFCFLIFCMGAQLLNSLWITLLELLLAPVGKSVMPILENVSGDSDTFSMFLYTAILAPIWEELLFRGYVLGSLRPFGKRFAVLGSAVLFGLFHGNLLQTPYAVIMGLLLGYVTVEYSLGWAMLLHLFNNLVLADLLTRLTANWPDLAYSILNLVLFWGSAVVSLAILLKNRRIIRAYRRSEWMDRRCLKCFFTSAGIVALSILMSINMVMFFLV